MRRLLALLTAVLLVAGPFASGALAARTDLADLEDEVMCVQCGRPLATSAGRAADDQRQLMQSWIDEGDTKQQVKDKLVDEYGKRVLVDDRSGIAAAAPWLTALVGGLSIALLLRARRQRGLVAAGADGTGIGARPADGTGVAGATAPRSDAGDGTTSAAPPATEISAADEARIDAELAERD